MKNKQAVKQVLIIALTFLAMALFVYAVFEGKILTQDETMKKVENGMIEKLK